MNDRYFSNFENSKKPFIWKIKEEKNQPNLIQGIKFTLHASSKNFYVNEKTNNKFRIEIEAR